MGALNHGRGHSSHILPLTHSFNKNVLNPCHTPGAVAASSAQNSNTQDQP